MSALAQYYLAKSHDVSGSDLVSSEMIEFLRAKGVKVWIGPHKKDNLKCLKPGFKHSFKRDRLVIYSPAVKKDNPELKEVKRMGIRCMSYPEALGELTKKHFTIAVSGTHGKSTTTAMIALVLAKAGLDPTVIVGTKIKEFGNSNFRAGKSKYLVIEADEHFASFLIYRPKIIVLTNIEKDHLDYYKNFENILLAFKKYISRLSSDGLLIFNSDDPGIRKILNRKTKKQGYSLRQKEASLLKKTLKVPGEHNVSNALAAFEAARRLGIPDAVSINALGKFRGSWRRFEIIRRGSPVIISDYAHHPTEITATIHAAKEYFPRKKIWAVFQPHQHQRTFHLFGDFIKAFDDADAVVLTDIFDVAGRETDKISKKVSSEKLSEGIKKRKKEVYFMGDFKKIPVFLKKRTGAKDILLIMGAGDIYKITQAKFWK